MGGGRDDRRLNWLDTTVLVLFAITTVIGLTSGFLRTVLGIVGVVLGLVLAPRISGVIEGPLASFIGSQMLAAVLSYIIVLVVITVAAAIIGNILRKIIGALFLGWADHAAGAALGLIGGMFIGLAVIAVIARLAFFVPADNPLPPGASPQAEAAFASLEKALVRSALVPLYLATRSAMPGKMQALVPGAFAEALDTLEQMRVQGGQLT